MVGGKDMAKPRRVRGGTAPPRDKKNFTIWTDTETGERIERAFAAAAARTGYPVSNSAWLLAQVMKAVDERRSVGREVAGDSPD
jgi:hypothetical protein